MDAIIRSYNTSDILRLIRGLWATRRVHHFIVVISAHEDDLDTPKLLRTLNCNSQIRPVMLEKFGWAKALNAGIKSLPPAVDRYELVMTVSNEVRISAQEIELMERAALKESAS